MIWVWKSNSVSTREDWTPSKNSVTGWLLGHKSFCSLFITLLMDTLSSRESLHEASQIVAAVPIVLLLLCQTNKQMQLSRNRSYRNKGYYKWNLFLGRSNQTQITNLGSKGENTRERERERERASKTKWNSNLNL